MIENIKVAFKMCKAYFIDVFMTVNSCIKHDNLLDAYMMLFISGIILFLILAFIGLIIAAIVSCPCILLILLIPLLPYVYILMVKKRIKNKKEIDE
jgi:hypothetical protein